MTELGNSTESPADNSQSRNQFSLLTLGLIVMAAAIALAIFGRFPVIPGQPNPSDETWLMVFRSASVIMASFCITGLALVVKEWIATERFVLHPGYLLAILMAVMFVGTRLVDLWFFDALLELDKLKDQVSQKLAWQFLLRWRYSAMAVAAAVALMSLLGLFRDRWWWRVSFGFAAVCPVLEAYRIWIFLQRSNPEAQITSEQLEFAGSIVAYCMLAWGVTVFASIIFDWVTKTKRDWLHWLGIFIVFLVAVLPKILLTLGLRYLSVQDLFGI